MKKYVSAVLIPAFVFLMLPVRHNLVYAASVKVKSGVPVVLKLTEEISSKTKNSNEIFYMEVARDVVVDGKVIISRGTPATGIITWAEKSGMVGKSGKLQISLDSTTAVDGQKVMLRSTVTQNQSNKTGVSVGLGVIICPLFLLMKGKEATMPVGTEIKGYIDNEITIEVSEPGA